MQPGTALVSWSVLACLRCRLPKHLNHEVPERLSPLSCLLSTAPQKITWEVPDVESRTQLSGMGAASHVTYVTLVTGTEDAL